MEVKVRIAWKKILIIIYNHLKQLLNLAIIPKCWLLKLILKKSTWKLSKKDGINK